MSILIRDVDAITLDADGAILRNTTIAIQGKAILAIGDPPPGLVADEVIDGRGHLALPGFFNAHSHAPMALLRGYAEDLSLERWFNERIWVVESGLTGEDVYWGAALAVCEMIRSGCVAFNDMYFHMDRVAEVVEQAGIKATLAWGVFGLDADGGAGADLRTALAFIERWHGQADGRIRAILGPHSPYICPPEFLREVSALARERGLPIHTHLAESAEQVENSLQRYGRTPAAHLEACSVFDVPCLAAHALYLSDDDVAILARHRVSVAHCPITYLKLAMGINDLPRLLMAGVNVAIGTDGPASNNDMDMKAALRFTALLQKHRAQDAEVLAGDLPLRLATANGAAAMGFPESGVLAPGRAADVVLFDLRRAHLHPQHDLVANLVHSARGSDVSHVIVDGRLIYRDGRILTLDEERIVAEAERRALSLVGRQQGRRLEYRG